MLSLYRPRGRHLTSQSKLSLRAPPGLFVGPWNPPSDTGRKHEPLLAYSPESKKNCLRFRETKQETKYVAHRPHFTSARSLGEFSHRSTEVRPDREDKDGRWQSPGRARR